MMNITMIEKITPISRYPAMASIIIPAETFVEVAIWRIRRTTIIKKKKIFTSFANPIRIDRLSNPDIHSVIKVAINRKRRYLLRFSSDRIAVK
jgi:hypothetical protein